MGKSNQIGKARLDKYYTLAKEKGYRARSAFKLIQMNRKYGFLENAHILIDLCAAPGSWSQVAAQEMPLRKKIIAVDIEPIKFIGDVETVVADITGEQCRSELKMILGNHKADVVLNDGAPNVGTSWENDAFNQNLLVLHSIKLASEFLKKDGVFVTKIFRSQDYFSLLDVMSRLFSVVETSKPLSSRSQSAEIFLVCMGFVGEDSVDCGMLEPSAVFKEEKEAGGYEDFNFCKKLKFTDFLMEDNPQILSGMLQKYSEIVVDLSKESSGKILEPETAELFKDLKVLGKGDIRAILKKRKSIVRMVREGEVEIEELKFLKVENEEEEPEEKQKSVEEKIEEIRAKMERRARAEDRKRMQVCVEDKMCFLNDNVFEKLRMIKESTGMQEEADGVGRSRDVEVSSCSDSLDLDEEEMMCVARLKENPDAFIEDTIDRNIRDPNEKLPNYLREDQEMFYSRPSKADETRMTKKEKEALMRRKTRAERRAEMFMKSLVVDDSEEEGMIAKKVYRSSFKKTKAKPRIVFSKKRGCGIPKGKGKLVMLDKRMKKDKRAKKA
ncbi:FtsJ-like methyltransferase [Ordospora pajunii]|uniref:FtsJ-like methyltransferase n=1 Tax=Ordospora pajunii TaxID=3039483 RepID=UPI00295288AE|nr:FtsJ-like methyltransferase [Ordospora pajunii]KAH9411087.1 FtsJ-like methyltransferase [Ordospora pajunii]